jgi:hypothetical protein
MQAIPLLSAPVKFSDGTTKTLSTEQLIMYCLDNPPEKGFTVSEMRARGRVATAVEQVREKGLTELVLEDADFGTLKTCVSQMKWAVRSEFILAFCEQFEVLDLTRKKSEP